MAPQVNSPRAVDCQAVTDYWLAHYIPTGHCSLCGNCGQIDTRATAVTAAGVPVGRVNFCICPNGQALRRLDPDSELLKYKVAPAKPINSAATVQREPTIGEAIGACFGCLFFLVIIAAIIFGIYYGATHWGWTWPEAHGDGW